MDAKEALRTALGQVSISRGDLVYLTGSVYGIQEPDPAGELILAVLSLLEETGTLVVPTFSFAFCDHGLFDRERSPSFCGALAERFRCWPGAIRSFAPPVHTVAAYGARAAEIAAIQSQTAFGVDSIFQWLVDHNAKVCLFGCTAADGVAHVHWLEEKHGVPYRHWRRFNGQLAVAGTLEHYRYHRYMRQPGIELDAGRLLEGFMRSPCIQRTSFGFTVIELFTLSDFVRLVEPAFRSNPSIMMVPCSASGRP